MKRKPHAPPDNQAMSYRLAAGVAKEPGTSPSSAIVAAGLFAIAASLDRLVLFVAERLREDDAREDARKAAEAKAA